MERDQAIKKISEKFAIPVAAITELLDGGEIKKKNPPILKKENVDETTKKKKEHVKKTAERKYLFTEDDYDLLIKKISGLLEEIRRLGKEIGDSCDESETSHDNFDYEECGRQQKMWTNHLEQFKRIKENAEIVKGKTDRDYISIGDQVEIRAADGEIIKKRIGSYLSFSKNDLSYGSPLAKLLMGKNIGDKVQGKINGKLSFFEILKIN